MQSYTYAYSTYSWHIQTFISSYRHAVISNSNELSPQLVCGTRSHSGQKTKSQNIVCLLARARWRWRWSQRFWPSASASNPVAHLPVMGSVRESLYLYRRFPSRATHIHTHVQNTFATIVAIAIAITIAIATTASVARKALRRRANPTCKLVSVQRTCTRFNAPHSTTTRAIVLG